MTKDNKPTMKDVSIEAGVALGTVSKVFNGIPVGDEYKKKVLAAAEKLGYQVNQYARGLRSNKTYTIALVVPTLKEPFYAALAEYSCEILHSRGYRTLLSTTDFDPGMEQECIDLVLNNKVDGIIAITYNPNLEIKYDIPFVVIDRGFKSNVPIVSSDNYLGGQMAAAKLVENGCKNLLFLGSRSSVPGEADKRSLGFENYCQNNKITYEKFEVIDEGMNNILDFLSTKIVNGKLSYDGIFCNTDSQAIVVMKYLKKEGLEAPRDYQLIGYDGIICPGTGEYFCSTIRQPIKEMAAACVDILINKDNTPTPSLVCLPVEYCFGNTTRL